MLTSQFLLPFLLWMNPAINLNIDHATKHCKLFDSGSSIKYCNYICHSDVPTDDEVQKLISVFQDRPFVWVVDEKDQQAIDMLEKHSMQRCITSLPAMQLDLQNLPSKNDIENFEVKEIIPFSADSLQWISIAAQARGSHMQPEELAKVIARLQQAVPGTVKMYLGFDQGRAVSASMMIVHGDTAVFHWVSTLPEMRRQGFAYAMSHRRLQDAKALGCKQAVVLSATAAISLNKRLGFQEYARYHMYGKKE